MQILDLAGGRHQMHRAVGSQLIYNLQSRQSLFLGVLTADRFMTILRLHLADSSTTDPRLSAYEVEATGTTELTKENSLKDSPAGDQLPLNLSVDPGTELSSEQLLFSVATDYHRQLENLMSQNVDDIYSAPVYAAQHVNGGLGSQHFLIGVPPSANVNSSVLQIFLSYV
jgi:hypothetical protein